jgi:hypothetical protein
LISRNLHSARRDGHPCEGTELLIPVKGTDHGLAVAVFVRPVASFLRRPG